MQYSRREDIRVLYIVRISISSDIYVCIYGQGLDIKAIFKCGSQFKNNLKPLDWRPMF